jgi:hypothetical protein
MYHEYVHVNMNVNVSSLYHYPHWITGFTAVEFAAVQGIFLQTELLFATLIIISFIIELHMFKLT